MRLLIFIAISLVLISPWSQAADASGSEFSNVAINGYVLTRAELAGLERQLGSRVAPGAYGTSE